MGTKMAVASPSKPAAPPHIEVEGNAMTFLPDGPDRLEALIRLIDEARETVRLLFYIVKDDSSGRRVRDALAAACGRGVRVTILIDGFGSEGLSDSFFASLVEHGCSFCRFEPRWGRRYLLRNHQKLALADNTTALLGGFNIADEYFGTVEGGAWRDIAICLKGPAADCLPAYFDALFDWARSRDNRIRDLQRILSRHSQNSGRLRWLLGGPTRRLSPWAQSVKKDMFRAHRLDLIAAYFAPSRAMRRRIYGIARRGSARIIMAAKSDNGATIGAARHTYWRLLKRGVEIYEYQATKLHTKLIVIDDVVHIGSANFDMRSLYLNLELMLRVEDAAFARAMRRFAESELRYSRQISALFHSRQRTWFNRIKWALCYFVVATMDYNVARRLNFGVRGN
jgi:cardiolipin synthase